MMATTADTDRAAALSRGLTATRERLGAACAAAGRAESEVELLVVTKFFPASDVIALSDLGCRAFGESREPEAGRKAAQVRSAVSAELRFHMIGQLQRRKARSVARWADRVHSVDSVRLADALAAAAGAALDDGERHAPLSVLLQINLDGDPQRGGVAVDELAELARYVTETGSLRLDGVMVIAPQTRTPGEWMERAALARSDFLVDFPDAQVFSAGMSGDLETAVAHGATCVRVGTAIMGDRPIVSP